MGALLLYLHAPGKIIRDGCLEFSLVDKSFHPLGFDRVCSRCNEGIARCGIPFYPRQRLCRRGTKKLLAAGLGRTKRG